MFLAQTFVFIVGLLVSEDHGFNPFKLATTSPVRLIKNAVDLRVVDDLRLHSDSFDHAVHTEVFQMAGTDPL